MIPVLCPVCRREITELSALCRRCETPHHPDCWDFSRGCAVFACGETRAELVPGVQLARRESELMVLDDSTLPSEPIRFPITAVRRATRRVESRAVMLVSWCYLGASLMVAIPALGYLMVGLGAGRVEPLVGGVCLVGCALGLKNVGDLLATGDIQGRSIHLYLCLLLALALLSPLVILVGFLAAPLLTRKGIAHFGLRPE